MEKFFNKYKLAKLTLAKIAAQFYDFNLPISEAGKYGIKYNNYDYRKKYINCCFNRFEPSGEFIWKSLGIEKPIITYDELWEISDHIKDEKYDSNKNYEKDYLKMSICAIGIITKFYEYKVPVKDIKIEYDKTFDEYGGVVDTYYHIFESAGEHAWELLGFKEPIIASSKVYNKKNQLTNRLLEIDNK